MMRLKVLSLLILGDVLLLPNAKKACKNPSTVYFTYMFESKWKIGSININGEDVKHQLTDSILVQYGYKEEKPLPALETLSLILTDRGISREEGSEEFLFKHVLTSFKNATEARKEAVYRYFDSKEEFRDKNMKEIFNTMSDLFK